MLLTGNPLAANIKSQLLAQKSQLFGEKEVYLAILMFGSNNPSQVYVNNKKKYAEDLGIACKIINEGAICEDGRVGGSGGMMKGELSKEALKETIHHLNNDFACIGIIVQLPLPDVLQLYKDEICAAVHPLKDIDGLGGILNGRNQLGLLSFQPATARAVLELWEYYQLGTMRGLKVAVIGQSNVVGKPLAIECLVRGAEVSVFTNHDRPEKITQWTKQADVLISCTGVIHLITKDFINPSGEQIVIDVGYGFLDGKAVGDVKFDEVEPLVKHITPVPGGVGPLTVASLFANMFDLQKQKKLIEALQH